MNPVKSVALAAALGLAAASAITLQVRAGGDKIAFPEGFEKGTMYFAFDHAASKTYREIFIGAAAINAAKNGQPVPSGTVIVTKIEKVKLGADGNPEKDANGRFIRTGETSGFAVMEKRTGWGAEYPPEKRNGEWEYQVFTADHKVNDKANLNSCFECHKPHAETDYLFTLDKIKTASAK